MLNSYGIGVDIIPKDSNLLVTIGIHPWSAEGICPSSIVDMLQDVEFVAIGEIGLDFSKDINRERQLECFEEQLEFAVKRDVPVVLHCVKAFEEIMQLLKKYRVEKVVFHSFIGSVVQLNIATSHGYYISISPMTLLSSRTVKAIMQVDMDYVFMETDNSGVKIDRVYDDVAKLLNISVMQLKHTVYNNYLKLFL